MSVSADVTFITMVTAVIEEVFLVLSFVYYTLLNSCETWEVVYSYLDRIRD